MGPMCPGGQRHLVIDNAKKIFKGCLTPVVCTGDPTGTVGRLRHAPEARNLPKAFIISTAWRFFVNPFSAMNNEVGSEGSVCVRNKGAMAVEFESDESTLEGDPRWEAAQRAVRSSALARATQLRAILLFIVRRSILLPEEPISEFEIAYRALGRRSNFNPLDDNIVRVQMGHLRRKLENYFSAEGKNEPIVISIALGSYKPVFQARDSSDLEAQRISTKIDLDHQNQATSEGNTAIIPAPTALPNVSEIASPDTLISWLIAHWLFILLITCGVTLVCIAVGNFVLNRAVQKGSATDRGLALQHFWKPLRFVNTPVIICVGTVGIPRELVNKPIHPVNHYFAPFVTLGTARAVASLTSLSTQLHIPYVVQSAPSIDLEALKTQPTIFIGGFTNPWTTRLMTNLRFRMNLGPPQEIYDTANPTVHWQIAQTRPNYGPNDYAIVARYHDPITNNIAVIIAGLEVNGTVGAAQFVTSSHQLEQLEHVLPSGWEDKNVEIVLKVPVIGGDSGPDTILATQVW